MARVAEQHDVANAHAADIATILGKIQTKDQKTTEVSDEISATFTLTKQYEDAIATAAVSAQMPQLRQRKAQLERTFQRMQLQRLSRNTMAWLKTLKN